MLSEMRLRELRGSIRIWGCLLSLQVHSEAMVGKEDDGFRLQARSGNRGVESKEVDSCEDNRRRDVFEDREIDTIGDIDMTKHKGRKHAGELVEALSWVREINDALGNKEGFESERLVKLEFIPYGDSDFFEIRYMGDLIFFPSDQSFNPKVVEGILFEKIDETAKRVNKSRRLMRQYQEANKPQTKGQKIRIVNMGAGDM